MRLLTREPPEYKAQHHPTTSSTLCRTLHLNNKQNKNSNQVISRQDYHLAQPCPSEEKQTNKQKLSTNLTKFTQTTGPISGGQKPKGRKNSTFSKEQTRNIGGQITEEEIGKLPEKEFRITIVKMIKTLKTKWRKGKNQLTKT